VDPLIDPPLIGLIEMAVGPGRNEGSILRPVGADNGTSKSGGQKAEIIYYIAGNEDWQREINHAYPNLLGVFLCCARLGPSC
jgi:hypothetical protein